MFPVQHVTLYQLNELLIIKTTGKHTLAHAQVYLILVYLQRHPNAAQQTNKHVSVRKKIPQQHQ